VPICGSEGPHILASGSARLSRTGSTSWWPTPASKAASIEDTKVEDFRQPSSPERPRAVLFFSWCRQLLPALCEGSAIIFTSSLAAHASVGALSAYGATKGAIDTLVKHFASALGSRGIASTPWPPAWWRPDMSTFIKTEAGREVAVACRR